MKRLLLITIAALTISTIECQAQSWLDMLKNAATTALDKVTGGQLTAKAIVGTWNYAKPGVRLTSKDNMSEITAAALTSTIQEKLVAYYEKAGIKAGVIKITMKEDGTFSTSFGEKTYTGTYTFDAENNKLELKYGVTNANGESAAKLSAFAYINGENLQILFAMDKLLGVITMLSDNVSSMSGLSQLLQNFDGLQIGFEFSR